MTTMLFSAYFLATRVPLGMCMGCSDGPPGHACRRQAVVAQHTLQQLLPHGCWGACYATDWLQALQQPAAPHAMQQLQRRLSPHAAGLMTCTAGTAALHTV
jgi:hypothetical protein